MYLLQEVEYEPGSTETKATTGTHSDIQDADATNLAITFTPDDDYVLIELEGNCFAGGTAPDNVAPYWNLREGSTNVFEPFRVMRSINPMRCYISHIINIAAPDIGVEKTWKWGHKSTSATIAVNLRMGGAGASAAGPATMRVYSVSADELLALIRYNPDPAVTPTMNVSAFQDLDAVNLAATFTPVDDILVELECYAHVGQYWNLREGSTDLSADGSADGMQVHGSDNIPGRIHTRYGMDNLSGQKTYKWGWRRRTSQCQLFYGTDYGPAEMRVWDRAAVRFLARGAFWPTTSGGHFANQNGGALEQYGNYTPDTANPLLAPITRTFTVPDVADPLVKVILSADVFTNVAATEHGYFALYRDGNLVSGSRKRVHSGGPNNKRRTMYTHIARNLPRNTEVTFTWMWEGTNADDVRSNMSDTGLTRALFEVMDVSVPVVSAIGGLRRRRGGQRRAAL